VNCCSDCGESISQRATRCRSCRSKHQWLDKDYRRRVIEHRKNPLEPTVNHCADCGKAVTDAAIRCGSCAVKTVWKNPAYKAEHSGENHHMWAGPKVIQFCEQCEKVIEDLPRLSSKRKFCSPNCVKQWRKEYYQGAQNPSWRGGPSQVPCSWCETLLERSYYAVRIRQYHFCNNVCRAQWQSKYRSGENHPNWRGGVSFEPYGLEFDDELRSQIRERDGYVCALCRKAAKCVHHINYDKQDHRPENLITLCINCHSQTGHNRSYWQSYFTGASHGAIMAAIPRYVPQGA